MDDIQRTWSTLIVHSKVLVRCSELILCELCRATMHKINNYDESILHDALEQITPACFNSRVWGLCVGSLSSLSTNQPYCPCSRSIPSPPGLISPLNLSANLEKEWQSCLCTCVYLYVGTVYRASVFYLVPAILLLPLVTRMNEEIKAGTSKHIWRFEASNMKCC